MTESKCRLESSMPAITSSLTALALAPGVLSTGMPSAVYSRGKKVSRWNGQQMEFVGEIGRGQFIKREPFENF